MSIIRSTVDLAHSLGLRIVPEGIDTLDALELVDNLGCEAAQGYLMGRPVPAEDFDLGAAALGSGYGHDLGQSAGRPGGRITRLVEGEIPRLVALSSAVGTQTCSIAPIADGAKSQITIAGIRDGALGRRGSEPASCDSGHTGRPVAITLRGTLARHSPERDVLTCATCGSKRIIPLHFDQMELVPPDARPTHKCVSCGVRIYNEAPRHAMVSRKSSGSR